MAEHFTPARWGEGEIAICEHDPETLDIHVEATIIRLSLDEVKDLSVMLNAWLVRRGGV